MFIKVKTKELFTYSQLHLQPEFEGVGWPYDPNISGIDDLVAAKGYARFYDTAPPTVKEGEIAEPASPVLNNGKWERSWTVRAKTQSDLDAEHALALEAVRVARAAEYPALGDQLDAIMKWLSTETEFTIPSELKSIAMTCMSVKARHPKPDRE